MMQMKRICIAVGLAGLMACAFDGLIDELSITDGFLDPVEMQPLKK